MRISECGWNSSGGFFDVPSAREELKQIEDQRLRARLLERSGGGAKASTKAELLEKKIQRQEQFESQIADAGVLFEFAEEDEDSLGELRSLVERWSMS